MKAGEKTTKLLNYCSSRYVQSSKHTQGFHHSIHDTTSEMM